MNDRIEGPAHQDDYHDGSDLHYAERFVAGFFYALDVFPPVINGHQQSERGGRMIQVDLRRAVKHLVHGFRNPAMLVSGSKQLIDKAGDILARGYAGNRAGEDVIKHQRGNAELGESPAESFFHHAIDAAAGEHGTAFHVNRAPREGEENDAKNDPRG